MRCLNQRRDWDLRVLLPVLAAGVLTATGADAATWRVARDGSGDFMTVGLAVDAAASGDTISIAPGIYPETPEYQTPSRLVNAIAYVLQSELTIVGDDRNTVILGGDIQAPNRELGPTGFAVATGNFRLRGVTVRNSASGIDANGEWVDVEDCRFVGGWQGVRNLLTGMATVRNCVFEGHEDAGVMVFEVRGATGAIVENCEFVGNGLGIDFQPLNCIVRDSSFRGGSVGVQVSFGGSGQIDRCTFATHRNYGVVGTGGSQVYLSECVLDSDMSTNVSVEGYLEGTGNHLAGGTWATLEFNRLSTIKFHGNHILNAGGWSVRAYSGPEPIKHFDLSGNYWGTTTTAQLDDWIYDHNDRESYWSIVDYLPLEGMPIPTEESSMGRLKARFADQ
ncbi:hypothetical protein DRQ53_14010 [bacterium]|nr:MAG: hypothetical protein DRQ53_14010 [bacterium]